MIIHLPTGLEFITQKDAKSYFGNHRYRKLVKENKIILLTMINQLLMTGTELSYRRITETIAGKLDCWKHTCSIVWLYAPTVTQWFQMSSKRH